MSENHLSNNLDKIIQLISIEQVRCLMKQMKIDDTNYNTTTATNTSATNTNETLDQLTKINNTLLLIVDKISAIETEIKMIKETKPPSVKHSGKAGLNQKRFGSSKGARYASGGMANKKGC